MKNAKTILKALVVVPVMLAWLATSIGRMLWEATQNMADATDEFWRELRGK